MRKKFLWVMGVWLIGAASLSAQSPSSPYVPPSAPPDAIIATQPPPPPLVFPGASGPPNLPASPVYVVDPVRVLPSENSLRWWVRTEFLLWWVKDAPQPISLVATDANNNPVAQLFDSSVNYKAISGARFVLGGWFDTNNNIGIDTSFFTLGHNSIRNIASSDDNGSPQLAIPFFSTTPGATGEFLLPVSVPGQFAGNVMLSTAMQLWGMEFNGVFCLFRERGIEWTILAGFRYVDLQENLNLDAVSTNLTTNNISFISDSFNTRNQFYGGQIGSRLFWKIDRLSLDVTGKLAVGSTHEVVDIQGNNSSLNGFASGGLFTQPTNMGRTTTNQFGIIPSVEMKFSYHFSPWWRVFVGYDFMYWNQVVRPGSQVDRNVNLSQSSVFGTGTLSGSATPMPLFNRTDFWAQGITFGLEFRF